MLLLFLFKKRFFYAIAVGILLVFNKESGFMLYGVSVFLFIPLMIFNNPSLLNDKKKFVKEISALIIPILLFVIYMVIVPRTQIGNSWTEGIIKMSRFYLLDKVIVAQLISLLVINFNWLISAMILINVVVISMEYVRSRQHKLVPRTVFNSTYEGVYFYIMFIAIIYFLTRIPLFNNPRYMLPTLPILIILLGESLVNVLRKQSLIKIALTLLLVLLTVSSFRTVDPVSKKVMGTFKFGSHEMLDMARFDGPGHEYGYGRDQLVYNFEFTQIHYLTEKIFDRVGWWQKVFVVAPNATWVKDFGTFDITKRRRAMHGERVYTLPFVFPFQILADSDAPRHLYYISYPHFDKDNVNENERAKLSRLYDLDEVITVEDEGYGIDVYHYVKKDR